MVKTFLVVRAGTFACALPIDEVIETMRPLPVRPVAGMSPVVRGLSIIRGAPVPVVDLISLMTGDEPGEVSRYVTLRARGRILALAVPEVIGVRRLEQTAEAPQAGAGASGSLRLAQKDATVRKCCAAAVAPKIPLKMSGPQ